jgi:hypothetical protein
MSFGCYVQDGTSYRSPTVPGCINTPYVTKNILVHSKTRDFEKYPNPNGYVIDLPRTYNNVIGVCLISAEIPSSFYVFSTADGNTSLTVTVDTTTHTITIPDGNYGFSSMITALTAALNAAFSGLTFEVAVNSITSKFTITCLTSPGTKTVSIDTTTAPASKNTEWGLAYYLGFPKGVVTSGVSNTNAVTASFVATMNPHNYLLLNIEEINATDHVGFEGGNSTFAKIPLTVNSYNLAFYDKILSIQKFGLPRVCLKRLHVDITFADGTLVDFQGMEHSFTIELTYSNERIISQR